MNILGIETSCDETAAAVIRDGRDILSNVVASSLAEHSKYGGVIPEIASRRQLELIHAVVDDALNDTGLTLEGIDAIAVTASPGLIGSLLVGISFARALAFAIKKPLIEVNHIQAHLYANFLMPSQSAGQQNARTLPKLPAIGLVVSGGHSSIFYLKSFSDVKLLGQTRDDAAGEAFDKVARILNLGYPGGPVIDRLAKRAASANNPNIRFKCADLPETFDFSFSGIKTAVLHYTGKPENQKVPVEQIAHAFQDSVVSVLADKCIGVCRQKGVKTLLLGGGVAANSALRAKLVTKTRGEHINVFFPPVKLCIDNAAMIAGLSYHMFKKARATR